MASLNLALERERVSRRWENPFAKINELKNFINIVFTMEKINGHFTFACFFLYYFLYSKQGVFRTEVY